jgi:hypothetical protein
MTDGEAAVIAISIFVVLNALNMRYRVLNGKNQTPFVITTLALTLIISMIMGTECGNCNAGYW